MLYRLIPAVAAGCAVYYLSDMRTTMDHIIVPGIAFLFGAGVFILLYLVFPYDK